MVNVLYSFRYPEEAPLIEAEEIADSVDEKTLAEVLSFFCINITLITLLL